MEKLSLSLILQNASLKSTPQRLAILNTIQKHGHICIDDIYNEIKKIFPSISLATVYKNIHTLKDEGILTEIHPQNIKSKYEIKKSPHGHFVCKNCGMIVDFELQNVCNPKIDLIKEIEDSEVYLYGICRKCKA